jgi:hypothetical protein
LLPDALLDAQARDAEGYLLDDAIQPLDGLGRVESRAVDDEDPEPSRLLRWIWPRRRAQQASGSNLSPAGSAAASPQRATTSSSPAVSPETAIAPELPERICGSACAQIS